jgi:ATP-dependent DNA ligase
MGLPCTEEAARIFKEAKIKSAVIPSELYRCEEAGRSRVSDTAKALADKSLQDKLRLAFFDIVNLDGEHFKSKTYKDVIEKLASLCGGNVYLHPARCETAESRDQVKGLFTKWVDEEGGEGLIVRSELPIVYKLKNRYTLDAVIVGFAEGTGDIKNQIRTLLVALMTEDGDFQVIGKCPGSTLDTETRKNLFQKLLDMKVESDYTEIDSNRLAFHMIKPEIVVEISINEAIFENNSGPIFDPLLEFKDGAYHRLRNVHGISMIHPAFSRFREDKNVNPQDIRHSQIDEIICNPYWEGDEKETAELEKSEILKREVYKSGKGDKLMVRKFLLWKTNKDSASEVEYPAYVLAYTDYSSGRADPLKSEVRISDSKEQILALYDTYIEKNVKKGWEKV